MPRVGRSKSVDNTQQPILRRRRQGHVNDLQRRKSVSDNNVNAPLDQVPQLPNQQYRESLRYHPRNTQRIVMQEAVDRASQKNLSRNTQEVLTEDTRFWDKKGDEAKGNLGLQNTDNLRNNLDWGPNKLRQQKATTLQKTTLHRRRMDLINHRNVADSRREITAIRDRELSRIHRNFVRPNDLTNSEIDNEQFNQLMTKARRDAEDVLTVLEFQIDALQAAQDNGSATIKDLVTCGS